MAQHYFSVCYDTKTNKFCIDAEVSINYDAGNIWDPDKEEWVYSDEHEATDEIAMNILTKLLDSHNKGE